MNKISYDRSCLAKYVFRVARSNRFNFLNLEEIRNEVRKKRGTLTYRGTPKYDYVRLIEERGIYAGNAVLTTIYQWECVYGN
jgi:hypothetical protein